MRSIALLLLLSATAYPQQINIHEDQYPGRVHKIFGWNGEPRHVAPTRQDANDEIDDESKTFWPGQPFTVPLNYTTPSDTHILCDWGNDFIIIQCLFDGKPDIVAANVRPDDTIDWAAVGWSNKNAHDHWTNAFGVITIENYGNRRDQVVVCGHYLRRTFFTVGEETPFNQNEYGPLIPGVPAVRISSFQGGGGGASHGDTIGFVQFPGIDGDRIANFHMRLGKFGVCKTYTEYLEHVERNLELALEAKP